MTQPSTRPSPRPSPHPRAHWAARYIGLPWENSLPSEPTSGRNPDAFDCLGFFRYVQAKYYGRAVSDIIVDAHDLRAVIKTFETHPERQRWQPTQHPQDGDAVLMRRSRHPVHVGLWLGVDGGGVLHCAEKWGVVFQDLKGLAINGWSVAGYYRHV